MEELRSKVSLISFAGSLLKYQIEDWKSECQSGETTESDTAVIGQGVGLVMRMLDVFLLFQFCISLSCQGSLNLTPSY